MGTYYPCFSGSFHLRGPKLNPTRDVLPANIVWEVLSENKKPEGTMQHNWTIEELCFATHMQLNLNI